MLSSRELIIEYLWTRTRSAWEKGDMEEAQDCARFQSALEGMSDAKFNAAYNEDAVEVR